MCDGGLFFNSAMPPKAGKNYDPAFIAQRRELLNKIMQEIILERNLSVIFDNKNLCYHFGKFLSPVQLGRFSWNFRVHF